MTIIRRCGDNWKMRFASKVGDKGRMWIAARDGPSEGFEENDDDMHINRADTSLGHCTEWIHLDSIADLGLSRPTREHIPLVDTANTERQEVAMANLKKSAEILVSIDAVAARKEKETPNANNGIIASRGFSGCVHFRFVSSIADLRAGGRVYAKNGKPRWTFQKEGKKSDDEAASEKSSSDEVANITTPDEEGVKKGK